MAQRKEQAGITTGHQPYQQDLLIIVSKVSLGISIVGILSNSLWFLWDPLWRTLVQNSAGLIMVLVFWWCLRLAHQGQVQRGVRIFLASGISVMILLVITAAELFIAIGLIGLCLHALIATFLEPPDVALRWGGVSILLYLSALTFRSRVPIFEFEPGLADLVALYLFPTLALLAFTLLGRNITRLLNVALTRSQAARRDLERREEALRTLNEQLEGRVLERTAELSRVNVELELEIAERVRVEEQISASLKEKEVLLKEIHHRIKNNLQIVSSLLNLQSSYVNDQQALESFQDSQHRIRSMALIHEKLYLSENLAQIDFAEYIRDLAAYVCRSQGANTEAISLNIQVDDVYLTVDVAVPCGLILSELVSNALKHAFPDGRAGEICIELGAGGNDQVILRVSDNGIGLPEALSSQDTTSLGLQLVNTLVNQLQGTLELDRSNGTEFRIEFAIP